MNIFDCDYKSGGNIVSVLDKVVALGMGKLSKWPGPSSHLSC